MGEGSSFDYTFMLVHPSSYLLYRVARVARRGKWKTTSAESKCIMELASQLLLLLFPYDASELYYGRIVKQKQLKQ